MTTSDRWSKALKPFLLVAGACLCVLAVDTYMRRPVLLVKPATADSLAGVLARMFPGRADSAEVAKITWWHSPEGILRWAPAGEYDYKTPGTASKPGTLVPIAAQADLKKFSVTFAKMEGGPELVKHEMVHLLLRQLGHPAEVFVPVETYRGR